MNTLVDDLLKYLKTGKIDSILKCHSIAVEDTMSIRVMVVDILSWLKLGYKRELWKREKKYMKHKPLLINNNYTWCRILKEITENEERFSELFYITDKEFDFRETVTEEERIYTMKLAYDKFNLVGRS